MTSYRLCTYESPNGPRAGIIRGDTVFDAAAASGNAAYASVVGILNDWPRAQSALQKAAAGKSWPLKDTHLHAPVLWPSAIYCAGINYTDHAAEMARRMGREPDPNVKTSLGSPWHFLKSPHAITDPGATITGTQYTQKLDWEIELAAIIGRVAKNVTVAHALDYVAGYTAANDVSARDRSRRMNTPQGTPFHYDWIGQKCFDGACPLGPWIVPATDIPDPQHLALKLWVNDQVKQDSNTRQMIFSLAEQIEHITRSMTLYPGDIILTGTPAGVGAGREEFLKAGDVVRLEIEKIGGFANTIA